jgi:phosphoribosylformylglycinamidine synthase
VKAKVRITLKSGVLDPQGKAIATALASLGFDGVRDVRQGKYIEIELVESDQERAQEIVEQMCGSLLANPLIETYKVDLEA